MESGGDQFSVIPPLFSGADKETISQPWLEESVFVRLLDVYVAVQDLLDVIRMGEEYDEIVSQPATGYVSIDLRQLQCKVHQLVVGLANDHVCISDQRQWWWPRQFIAHLHEPGLLLPVVHRHEDNDDRHQGDHYGREQRLQPEHGHFESNPYAHEDH